MPESAGAANRRVVGVALLASASVLGLVAILFGAGVFRLPDEGQTIAALAIAAAAVVDALIGLRLLRSRSR